MHTNAVVKDSMPMEDYLDAVTEMKKEYMSSRADDNHVASLIEVNYVNVIIWVNFGNSKKNCLMFK